MNFEAQNLTMTGIHPVQIYGRTAQGASTAQVNAICKNLKMCTVMGKTQACAISTVAWSESVRSAGKGSHFGKRPQTLEPSCRPNLCHHLLGVGGGLEAERTRFLANARRQCYSGWRFVHQGADHRQLLQGYRNANKEGNFVAARALDFLVCGATNEPRLLADGSTPNKFSVFVATREPWPPGSTNCGNAQGNKLINHAHM